jgi:hypothetical protein
MKMEHILKLVSSDRQVQHQAYVAFRKKWPQLNDQTRIAYTEQRSVYIAEVPPVSLIGNMIRVVVSGWQKLRNIAMTPTLKRLDDPKERIAYSHRLWVAIFKSPTYLFWRFTGRLFNRRDLYERGTELVPNPVMPHFIRREIQLEMFGWEMTYSWDLRREPQRGYFVCGYDPLTDTLWIRR